MLLDGSYFHFLPRTQNPLTLDTIRVRSHDSPPQPQPNAINPFSSIQPTFFFTIGSVESFERKLEVSQREMGIEPKGENDADEGNIFGLGRRFERREKEGWRFYLNLEGF